MYGSHSHSHSLSDSVSVSVRIDGLVMQEATESDLLLFALSLLPHASSSSNTGLLRAIQKVCYASVCNAIAN
jgi:hypothetical protein